MDPSTMSWRGDIVFPLAVRGFCGILPCAHCGRFYMCAFAMLLCAKRAPSAAATRLRCAAMVGSSSSAATCAVRGAVGGRGVACMRSHWCAETGGPKEQSTCRTRLIGLCWATCVQASSACHSLWDPSAPSLVLPPSAWFPLVCAPPVMLRGRGKGERGRRRHGIMQGGTNGSHRVAPRKRTFCRERFPREGPLPPSLLPRRSSLHPLLPLLPLRLRSPLLPLPHLFGQPPYCHQGVSAIAASAPSAAAATASRASLSTVKAPAASCSPCKPALQRAVFDGAAVVRGTWC